MTLNKFCFPASKNHAEISKISAQVFKRKNYVETSTLSIKSKMSLNSEEQKSRRN